MPWLDVACIGHPVTRKQGAWAGVTSWLAGAARVGETEVQDLEDVVRAVEALPSGTIVEGLFLLDHGSAAHCWVGDEDIGGSALDSPGYAKQLARLRPYLMADGLVHVQNCNAGLHEDMLRALARHTGVCAYGGTGKHHALFNFNLGSYRCAYPSGPVITCDRPRSIGRGG